MRSRIAFRERTSPEAIAKVVEAAADSDQQAWDALIDEFAGLIWAIARAHRLDDADAADVAQATWLRLFENLGRLRDPGHVGAWLATTARRECLRVLRMSARSLPVGDEVPDRECSGPLPGDALITGERNRALWRSFARLRASDQALLRLLVADPPPAYEEIALALDMPIGSIGPTRQRALRRLSEELEHQGALSLMTA
ncbi:MAG: RNA polymerase sigma factor [Solirubrobacteraceae bacterium]